MTHTKKQREQYNLYRDQVCEDLKISKNDFNYLRLQGEKLHRIYEKDCNGEYEYNDDGVSVQYELEHAPLVHKLAVRCFWSALYYYLQTDPRGCTVYVSKKFKLGNDNYDSVGVAIY